MFFLAKASLQTVSITVIQDIFAFFCLQRQIPVLIFMQFENQQIWHLRFEIFVSIFTTLLRQHLGTSSKTSKSRHEFQIYV